MKRILLPIALLLLAAVGALAWSFAPRTLPVPDAAPAALAPPPAQIPADLRVSVFFAGLMQSRAGLTYRGGSLSEPRDFGMDAVLVEHPRGRLLFDSGFGSQVDRHVATIPWLMRATTRYQKGTPVAEQLRAAGIDPASLMGVVLTHAHWDHVSGLGDLGEVPVWVTKEERAFIESGHRATRLAREIGKVDWREYDFPGPAYLGFPRSYDVFADGSIVLVPAPGHTPGSIVAFITAPDGKRYALIGDLVWQREGVELPAERPWLSRRLVDDDPAAVRDLIVRLHQLKKAMPELVIVPAHDRRVMETLPKRAP